MSEVCRVMGITKAQRMDWAHEYFKIGKYRMTDHNDTATPMTVDVKHHVIQKDADGNEIRVEVTEDQVKKDLNV
jgi:hypothetical protein